MSVKTDMDVIERGDTVTHGKSIKETKNVVRKRQRDK
jgi:hypothetical protein